MTHPQGTHIYTHSNTHAQTVQAPKSFTYYQPCICPNCIYLSKSLSDQRIFHQSAWLKVLPRSKMDRLIALRGIPSSDTIQSSSSWYVFLLIGKEHRDYHRLRFKPASEENDRVLRKIPHQSIVAQQWRHFNHVNDEVDLYRDAHPLLPPPRSETACVRRGRDMLLASHWF